MFIKSNPFSVSVSLCDFKVFMMFGKTGKGVFTPELIHGENALLLFLCVEMKSGFSFLFCFVFSLVVIGLFGNKSPTM